MNLLTVENISKSYGELMLFSDISFGINKDQKIALIAKNGSGKTSILNIMSGKDTSETGQVTTRKGIKISFLEQEPDLNPNLTIEETIFATDNEILRVIASYEKAVENPAVWRVMSRMVIGRFKGSSIISPSESTPWYTFMLANSGAYFSNGSSN